MQINGDNRFVNQCRGQDSQIGELGLLGCLDQHPHATGILARIGMKYFGVKTQGRYILARIELDRYHHIQGLAKQGGAANAAQRERLAGAGQTKQRSSYDFDSMFQEGFLELIILSCQGLAINLFETSYRSVPQSLAALRLLESDHARMQSLTGCKWITSIRLNAK